MMASLDRAGTSCVDRWWKSGGLWIAFFVTASALWLLSYLVPQHRYFVKRVGVITSADIDTQVRSSGNFIDEAVQLTTSTGLVVNLRVLRPAHATKPVPLLILLGGQHTGRDAVDVLGEPGQIAVAALDYPYHGPDRAHGVIESLAMIPSAQRALLDTPPAVLVAANWLCDRPWVDAKRVELMGLSLGVPFAAAAGALDSRFRRVWLIHGRVGNREWIAKQLENRIPNGVLRKATAWLVHLLANGASFRTEEWVPQIAPRRVVVIGAMQDEQMSRNNVEELYKAASEPKELLWSTGGHVQPKRHLIVQQLLAMVRTRIEQSPVAKD
jgi:hypothetical protein